jgi:hypothetical protein
LAFLARPEYNQAMRSLWFVVLIAAIGLGSAAPTPADTTKLVVSRKDCARLTKHIPRADVEYKAGVDVRGKKVKPADLPGGNPIKMPEQITIDIGFDLADKFGLGTGGKYEGKGYVGKVTVKGDKVYWNDQPLDQRDQQVIADACRKTYGK